LHVSCVTKRQASGFILRKLKKLLLISCLPFISSGLVKCSVLLAILALAVVMLLLLLLLLPCIVYITRTHKKIFSIVTLYCRLTRSLNNSAETAAKQRRLLCTVELHENYGLNLHKQLAISRIEAKSLLQLLLLLLLLLLLPLMLCH
jgi:hypothetical protein